MKVFSGILAILLGIAALLSAVGLQTVWAPPEQVTAEVTEVPADAPLTVIHSGIDDVDDAPVQYTLTGEGKYTLMLGQTRDIEAWVGDAAHNTITGIDTEVERGETPRIVIEHTEGEAEVPNPSISDLWVDIQQAEGTIDQRWSTPEEGDWSVLVVADGTAPAPVNMTVTWVNKVPDSPWITPLYIVGSVLIFVGILILVWTAVQFQRKRRRPSGRRVASPDNPPTAMVPVQQETQPTQNTPGSPSVESGHASAATFHEDPVGSEDLAESLSEHDRMDVEDPEPAEDHETAKRGKQDDDDDDGIPPVIPDVPNKDEVKKQPPPSPFLKRLVAGLSGIGLVTGISVAGIPAAYADEEQPAPEEQELASEEAADPDQEEALFPVVVEDQLIRIVERVTDRVAEADADRDPAKLTRRITGQAKAMRSENYRNLDIDEELPGMEPLASEPILSAWMAPDEQFPRTMVVITEGDDNQTPQLMVLEQSSPREQYQLTSTVELIPGAELPGGAISDTATQNVDLGDSEGLPVSPQEALEGMAEYLTDEDSEMSDQMADNVYIDVIHDYQEQTIAGAADATITFARGVHPDDSVALRLPDGSALVIGHYNSRMNAVPEEDGAAIVLDDVSAELAGENSSELEGEVRMTYREAVVLHIPAESESDEESTGHIALVGMSDELAAVEYLD